MSEHARRRMRQRGISLDAVDEALRHPIEAPEPGNQGNLKITGLAGGRRLAVVVTPDRGTLVTAFWRG